jgi:putative hydrolase of the HAD superfamily
MVEWVRKVKTSLTRTAILSDQTLWLEELNEKYGFFRWFERVFNSYHIGKSKRDALIFDYVLAEMDVWPHEALFVDDNPGNIQRAKEKEINTIHYETREGFERELLSFCPSLRGD